MIFTSRHRSLPPLGTLATLVVSAVWTWAPATASAARAEWQDVAGASGWRSSDADELPRPRYLLREGTLLRRMVGTIREEPDGGASFAIRDERDPLAGYRLILTPGRLLEEVLESLRTGRRADRVFEVTGRILVHRNRNYLLLTQPAILLSSAEERPDAVDATDADDDSAEAIIRDLERSVSSVPRRPGDGEGAPLASEEMLHPEGTRIVQRRGRLRRTPGGAYLFVFESDATGLADPPMTVIPCMLLESLERVAMERDQRSPILLTGTVFVFNGRNYVLPTVFRIPRDHSSLSP